MDIVKKVSILVVDDTPQNLVAFETILNELGQQLVFATSAKEALHFVLQQDFAVILLDVHMPDLDGFEAARLIRSREKSSRTPIIFITAFNKTETDINQGYVMGAVDYVFKPVDAVILRAKVKVFVDLFTQSALAINLQKELAAHQAAETARKQQRRLELAELCRLSSIEEMASALAHELNQPLATITNYVTGCIHRLKTGNCAIDEILPILERTGQQAEHAGAIIHRIKNFVRKKNLRCEPVDLNKLLIETASLVQEIAVKTSVHILFDLSTKLPRNIMIDKVQIEQVIINLLRNGIEAFHGYKQATPTLIIQTELANNETILVNVKDNGPGIDQEHTSHLFKLYFTTKASGMGIGLSICRTIIEAHGGNIFAKNNPEGGAWFQFTVPIKLKIK